MAHLFDPITLRGLTLKNRIAMAPMCQYSAGPEGMPNDWHLVHYVSRAIGGVGLVIVEATAVEPVGRISERDLGIWDDRQTEALARIVSLCHERGARIGIQLGHAGRKAWSEKRAFGPEQPVAPSAIPFDEDWNTPRALGAEEIDRIVAAFRKAARRATDAGFDVVELHAAHGYLINQFLSPLSNKRDDQYGGSLEGRMRLLHRVVAEVREIWPERSPLFVRVSASDYTPGGMDIEQMVEIARTLGERGVDLVDTSSGGVAPAAPPSIFPGYQVPFAHRIKRDAGIATGTVGLITRPEMAEEIVRNKRADLVILGRELLRHPYWPLEAARELGVELDWPIQYRRAKR
ncbi:MAG TPA: NADPH dehydrogenase NamA [Chloroflexota bacterium]|nr:NADPH dehydrogenase NamA [Chloroflexota bacterium]